MELKVRTVLEQAIEDLTKISKQEDEKFELNLQINDDIKIVLKEIERLNKSLEEQRHFYLKKLEQKDNIIREIEDMLENPWNIDCINQNNNYLHKLLELKGSDK